MIRNRPDDCIFLPCFEKEILDANILTRHVELDTAILRALN